MSVSEDIIMNADSALLHHLVPPLLREEDTRIGAAMCLARRLQSQVDSQSEVAAVVRLLCVHCASDDFLLELFLELLLSVEYKQPIIHSIALSAVDATEQQVQAILDVYRELLAHDRKFLVPIVGSISELQLTPPQRESFLSLIEGSLALVDDSDIPTMVSALLQLTTATNAIKIMRSIRTEAAHVTISIASLLASPLVASIRARSPCARAYIAELSRTPPLTSMDVVVVTGLLQVPSMRRAAAGALFAAISIHPPAVDTLRVTLSSHVGSDPANIHLVYLPLQLSLSRPLTGGGSSSGRRGAALWQQLQPSMLLATSVAIAGAIILHHAPLRKQAITALLTACATRSFCERTSATHASADPYALLQHAGAGATHTTRKGIGAVRPAVADTWTSVDCAHIAAGTLLQIAEGHAACLLDCSDKLCQFYAQHAAVCDYHVLHLISVFILLHTAMCVLILLYMCPHTATYVSLHYCTCVFMLRQVSSYYCMCPHTTTIHVSSYLQATISHIISHEFSQTRARAR